MENEATTTIVGGGSGGGGGDKEGGERKEIKSSHQCREAWLSIYHVYTQMVESWTQQAQHSTMKDPMCFTVHTVQWCGG